MGILSGLKQLNDARKERNEAARSARREARIQEIESFIKKEYSVHDMGVERILGSIGDTGIFDLDRTVKASAPILTTMLEEIYLNQEKVSQMHELEGRYAELRERYDELKKEHDALILELTRKEQFTR
ncbi:hypothetical protein [uncultured Selenomonas sp.]|uniref:hypothetical protein n=1 Tax=uncultured Selenomonas sp. TaxID=159275 RepID=UPI0028EB53C6|nr:hypothetical protein [uncultured Selenomonas sp.]